MYKVILSDGTEIAAETVAAIKQLYFEGSISQDATVEHRMPVSELVSPNRPATDRQKEFATSLSVSFHPEISRSEISKLIDTAIDARDEKRLEQMFADGDREREARALLIAEMESDGNIWLHNATPTQMLDELEGRVIATLLISMKPDGVSTFVAINDEGMNADLAAELDGACCTVQTSMHIQLHEIRKVMMSIAAEISDE